MSEASAAADVRPLPRNDAIVADRWPGIARFVGIAAQLGVVFALLRLFDMEAGSGILRILPLVFAGFLANSALPMRSRPGFFLLLSFAAIGVVLGPRASIIVIALGIGLFALFHLPTAFWIRVSLVVIAGATLAAFR